MISPEELTPGMLVCLDGRSGIQDRYQRLMPRFQVGGVRRTVSPKSLPYIWLTGWELDDQSLRVAHVGWTFLRRDGISPLAPGWRRARLLGPAARRHLISPAGGRG